MKSLKKIFIYLLTGIAVIVVAAIASTFLFKGKIICEFIREANKSVGTPVRSFVFLACI